jgi:hypothetical protein
LESQQQNLAAWKLDVVTRITDLERRLNAAETNRSGSSPHPPSTGLTHRLVPASCRALNCSSPASEGDYACPKFQSGTDLLTPISILDRSVGGDAQELSVAGPSNRDSSPRSRITDSAGLTECCEGDLQMWSERTRTQDVDNLRAYIKIYFSCLNPHCKDKHPRAEHDS